MTYSLNNNINVVDIKKKNNNLNEQQNTLSLTSYGVTKKKRQIKSEMQI